MPMKVPAEWLLLKNKLTGLAMEKCLKQNVDSDTEDKFMSSLPCA
jgi:hypothetical protein